MAKRMMVSVLVVITFVLLCKPRFLVATEYLVGGNIGLPNWRQCCDDTEDPAGLACCTVDYSAWARTIKFFVGDILEFNFNNMRSNVKEVGVDVYNTCKGALLVHNIMTSPLNFTLNSTGVKYFVTDGYFCPKQRFVLEVMPNPKDEKNSSSPLPSTPPPPPSSPPPPPSSGSSSSGLLPKILGPVLASLVGAIAAGFFKLYRDKKKEKAEKKKKEEEAAAKQQGS